ncbi:alpha/beta hydrolase fold protein [Dietzia cinnamea P4]|nr:alpha/beta hydrolase fold protein [Dietzia cinnamea P4]OAH57129.1 alpha/beta hydrolase [Dietzia cinnamea]
MTEHVVHLGERVIAVYECGDPEGSPVVHFHGTPGSRFEMDFGSSVAERAGVRVIGFDRPGYGRSSTGPISLRGIAGDVRAIADHLGVERFAVSAWSGGTAFALATAAALPERVIRAGVSGGLAPFEHMPEARAALTPDDLEALSHLPAHPDRAAASFLAGNSGLFEGMLSVRDDESAPWTDWMWADSDAAVIADAEKRHALFVNFHEALRQGAGAIAWDNVAFVGPWGFRVEEVRAPVHLWYGDRDGTAPPDHGRWLAAHLPDAHLTVFSGEGHLLPLSHWAEMLRALISPG